MTEMRLCYCDCPLVMCRLASVEVVPEVQLLLRGASFEWQSLVPRKRLNPEAVHPCRLGVGVLLDLVLRQSSKATDAACVAAPPVFVGAATSECGAGVALQTLKCLLSLGGPLQTHWRSFALLLQQARHISIACGKGAGVVVVPCIWNH